MGCQQSKATSTAMASSPTPTKSSAKDPPSTLTASTPATPATAPPPLTHNNPPQSSSSSNDTNRGETTPASSGKSEPPRPTAPTATPAITPAITTSVTPTRRTVTRNPSSRGGGGMCPFSQNHQNKKSFTDLNVAQLAGLGKASAGKTRELTEIPEGYRIETTGIRVQWKEVDVDALTDDANGAIRSNEDNNEYRGFAYAASVDAPTAKLRTVELSKRSEANWSGLHLHLDANELLFVQVQQRTAGGLWQDSFPPIQVQPLKAFTIQDQDIAWLKTPVDPASPINQTNIIWTELSLQKKRDQILTEAKGTNILSKQRKFSDVQFEPGKRDPEELENDALLLQQLLSSPDPMTKQDKVYMKDIWNKCLGWINMTGEHFVESLFLRCPDLLQLFGAIPAELAFDMFVSLIDLSVRNLESRTEVIARETYGRMPLGPKEDAPFTTLKEGFTQFAQLGMRPRHWKEARAMFIVVLRQACPYLEEHDFELLSTGVNSCAYQFWTHHIMKPALLAIRDLDDVFDSVDHRNSIAKSFEPLAQEKQRAGMAFYKKLFTLHKEVIPYFGTTDMDFLAGHLFEAIELLINSMNNFEAAIPVLQQLGKIHDRAKIPVSAYGAIGSTLDETFREILPHYGDGSPEGEKLVQLWSALMNRTVLVTTRISFVSERLLRKAKEWTTQVAEELKWSPAYLDKRHFDIEEEIRSRGTYTHTEEEVVHGARVAWRNSAKCIGRIAWNTLMVRDRRHVTKLDDMFAECLEHQRLATADGSLKAVMTVFRPRQPGTRMGTRFWNLQLVRFACYETEDGSLMGDGANKAYTDECIAFGWKPPTPRTEFDVLPIVIEDPIAGITKMYELPKEYHKVTMITHPKYPEFDKLGLRWCVVPTVTSFTLKIGGIEYPCNPFNGWFMETEITRDLLEPGRMNKMEPIARAIGVDPCDEEDFWRERVAIEVNKAIMHSFRRDGHSIVDHVTAQSQFLAHDAREKREGRECPAQWSWVVPAFGGSTLPIWHHEMRDFYIEPQYDYQAEIYAVRKESGVKEEDLLAEDEGENTFESLLIVYASVTGTAEGYAYKAKKMLRPLKVDVMACESLNPTDLWSMCLTGGGKYSAVLFITSTFGEGSPPPSATAFFDKLKSLPVSALAGSPFAVMAIGSSIYPDYCQAGIDLNKALLAAGGSQILPLAKGDEVNGQADAVMRWVTQVGSVFALEQKKALIASSDATLVEDESDPVTVEMLAADDKRVAAAVAEENELVPTNACAGAVARSLPRGYKLCKVTLNDELVDFSTEGSRDLFKSTRYLEFDLDGVSKEKTAADLTYNTGDHARILPVNDPSVVIAMCDCLGLAPEQWVHVKVNDGPSFTSSTMRVGDLLSLEMDLALQEDANLALLNRMLEIARSNANESSKAELGELERIVERLQDAAHVEEDEILEKHVEADEEEKKEEEKKEDSGLTWSSEVVEGRRESAIVGGGGWSSDVAEKGVLGGAGRRQSGIKLPAKPSEVMGSQALVQEERRQKAATLVSEQYVTIPKLLQSFPATTSKLSLADCIETLPRLKPRHYSIASSCEMHPTSLQLVVGKLTIVHKSTGNVRNGVCSHFLARTSANESEDAFCSNAKAFVRLGVNTSKFRLPNDYEAPLIMIGPGTGFAPMHGFLQAREKALADGKKLGPCMVFFGCRAENDFIRSEKMREWEKSGVITELHVAFSRLPGRPKEYVQNKVAQNKASVWRLLSRSNAHYYICGDSKMAEDVFHALKVIAKVSGGLDYADTFEFFTTMKNERRFQSDTWGVVEKREVNLKKLVEKNYNKAEHWLNSFDRGESFIDLIHDTKELQV